MGLAATLGVTIAGLAAPIGIVIAIIAALIAAGVLLYTHWDQIKAKAIELKDSIVLAFNNLKQNIILIWTTIKTFLQNLWTAIKVVAATIWEGIKAATLGPVYVIASTLKNNWNSIKSTAAGAWNAIKTAIVTPIQEAKDTIMGIIDVIKSKFPVKLGKIFDFKIPKVEVGSKTVKVGDKDVTVPTFDISWYAKGGIFDSASLIGVGEAGPEAVVPLDKFWEEIRNSNARTDQILEQQSTILIAMYEEMQKEKNFKVDGIWAGRYVNSLVKQ